MPDASAMSSYAALASNELWNQARLRAYVANGLAPNGYSVRCNGCEGLEGILPCVGSEPPATGYCLPEKDLAPWYDPTVPESRDFAGLLVMDVTVSAPYGRTVTDTLGDGAVLGRLRKRARTITVRGWLIGKTCCATAYGLRWLTSALDDQACGGDCGGSDLDFLACCPSSDLDTDCVTGDCGPRTDQGTEYQRGSDYWRRYKGVGIVDGPTILSCRGTSCGCSCGNLLEVEFTLSTSSPWIYSLEDTVLDGAIIGGDCEDAECAITWCLGEDDYCDNCNPCPDAVGCTEDPLCPTPALPPMPIVVSAGCGCLPQTVTESFFPVATVRDWGDSTLNLYLYAGSKDLRNVRIDVIKNGVGIPCSSYDGECDACSSILVAYVPAYGTLTISGEERKVMVECKNVTSNAFGSVASSTGGGFEWPDLTCQDVCIRVLSDCENTATDATLTVGQVNRDL